MDEGNTTITGVSTHYVIKRLEEYSSYLICSMMYSTPENDNIMTHYHCLESLLQPDHTWDGH